MRRITYKMAAERAGSMMALARVLGVHRTTLYLHMYRDGPLIKDEFAEVLREKYPDMFLPDGLPGTECPFCKGEGRLYES